MKSWLKQLQKPDKAQLQDHLRIQQLLHERQHLDVVKERKSRFARNERFYTGDLSADIGGGSLVRILEVEPGRRREPLVCRFKVVPLKHEEPYSALSYCWGDQFASDPETITIDECPGFCVSGHLADALFRLRCSTEIRRVWIDAICINQHNVCERNHQVQLMRSVYSHAAKVVVWLGEINAAQPSCERYSSPVDHSQEVCCEPGLQALEHGDLEEVLKRKLSADSQRSGAVWWKRIWVLQEFAVSRLLPAVYVGPHAIRWEFFAKTLWTDSTKSTFSELRSPERKSFYQLMRDTHATFHTNEPRDKIYALLGLVKQDESIHIVPDYRKSVISVYEDVMLHVINVEGTPDMIVLDGRAKQSAAWPTWIPDLGRTGSQAWLRSPDNFCASGKSSKLQDLVTLHDQGLCMMAICTSTRALCLRGWRFDAVKRKVQLGAGQPRDLIKFQSEVLETLLLPLLQTKTSDGDALRLIDRVPSMGYLMLWYLYREHKSIVELRNSTMGECRASVHSSGHSHVVMPLTPFEFLSRKFVLQYFPPSEGGLSDQVRKDLVVAAYWMAELMLKTSTSDHSAAKEIACNSWKGRTVFPLTGKEATFFSTDNGFVGLGPLDLQEGDQIVVPVGASKPFVLRSHGDHSILVGDAVVPGIMSGRLKDLYDLGKIEEEEFFVR